MKHGEMVLPPGAQHTQVASTGLMPTALQADPVQRSRFTIDLAMLRTLYGTV